MRPPLIYQRGDLAATQVVDSPADQRESLGREVRHRGREIQLAGEPRLHHVVLGRGHVHQVIHLERAHVPGDDLVDHGIPAAGSARPVP